MARSNLETLLGQYAVGVAMPDQIIHFVIEEPGTPMSFWTTACGCSFQLLLNKNANGCKYTRHERHTTCVECRANWSV